VNELCILRALLPISALQCVAVCCSVLQCVAVCCSVLQCVAVCCSVLRCAWIVRSLLNLSPGCVGLFCKRGMLM